MIDKSYSNVSDAFAENPRDILEAWLKDHTDPQNNPWAHDKWKQAEDDDWDDDHENELPNCVDPTANRLYSKLYDS